MIKRTQSLYFLILISSLLAIRSHCSKNSFLKLVRYEYSYGVKMAAKNLLKYFETNPNIDLSKDPFMKIQDFQEFDQVPASRFNEINNYKKIIKDNMGDRISAYRMKNPQNYKVQHYEIDSNGNMVPVQFNDPKKQFYEDQAAYKVDPRIQKNENLNQFHDFNMNDLNKFLDNQNRNKQRKEPKKDFFSNEDNQYKPLPKYEPSNKSQPKFNSKNQKSTSNMNTWEYSTSKLAFKFLNDFRKTNGLNALQWDEEVYKVSRPHSMKMASLQKISHDGFDNRANKLEKIFRVWQSAENVAYFMTWEQMTETDVARKLTDQWINSAGHRMNMLLPDLTHAAVSIVQKGTGGVYYYGTQFFIRK